MLDNAVMLLPINSDSGIDIPSNGALHSKLRVFVARVRQAMAKSGRKYYVLEDRLRCQEVVVLVVGGVS